MLHGLLLWTLDIGWDTELLFKFYLFFRGSGGWKLLMGHQYQTLKKQCDANMGEGEGVKKL